MLYLEDYVELIEHLPTDLQERFAEMRDMDLQMHATVDNLNNRGKELFEKCAAKKAKFNGAEQVYEEIRGEYYKVLEDADEKVQLANQIYDLVDRHLRKLDQELSKFKMELEADNAGITEILEQRSLELDNPVAQQRGSVRERKRAHASSVPSSSSAGCSLPPPSNNGDSLQPEKRIKLENATDSDSSALQPQAADDAVNVSYAEKPFPSSFDRDAIPSSYDASEGSSGGSDNASTVTSGAHDKDASVASFDSNSRRSTLTKSSYDSFRSESGHRLAEYDVGSMDSLDTSGEHVSDSSLSSMLGPTAQRPSRTKKQTSKAAAWVQERKQQAEARHEQKKKDSVPSTSGTQDSADESGGVEVVGESAATVDWHCDPNEPRYCICNQVSYGEMVGCDNEKCPIEWFHYGCVNLTEAPKGKWYCPQCTQTMKRRHKR